MPDHQSEAHDLGVAVEFHQERRVSKPNRLQHETIGRQRRRGDPADDHGPGTYLPVPEYPMPWPPDSPQPEERQPETPLKAQPTPKAVSRTVSTCPDPNHSRYHKEISLSAPTAMLACGEPMAGRMDSRILRS